MTPRFVRVALPRPVPELFHYEVPQALAGKITRGSVIQVPFGKRAMAGVIVDLVETSPVPARKILTLSDLPPVPGPLMDLVTWASGYYLSPPGLLLKMALPPSAASGASPNFALTTEGKRELERGEDPCLDLLLALSRGPRTSRYLDERHDLDLLEDAVSRGLIVPAPPRRRDSKSPPEKAYSRDEKAVTQLTPAQKESLDILLTAIREGGFKAFLLHGATGSGKTEVYLRAAKALLDAGKRVLFLVPEISLTPLLISRLDRLAPGEVVALHSGMTATARAASFRKMDLGSARIVVGVRSGVFTPIPDLGLIIVDEEHDPSFRQEDTPSYNARDVAVKRAQLEGIPVILGSATPSFESWHNAASGRYTLLRLPERATPSPDPELILVDMSDPSLPPPEIPSLSRILLEELEGILQRGEQAILFLNRRGFAPFLLCSKCRQSLPCPNCSVTFTYHSEKEMLCHYCGQKEIPPKICPACGAGPLRPIGAGTRRIEKALSERFPSAVIDRLDRDALNTQGALQKVYRGMDSGVTRILVGTQMLSKGHDFPNVTLAGILNAEQALDLPDFRSAERTFQIITQVAGRAGRGPKRGKVIVQTWVPDHYALVNAIKGDYEAFYRTEMVSRKELGYPPFGRLGRVVIDGVSEEKVIRAASGLVKNLPAEGLKLLGPSPAPISRLRGRFRWHFLVLAKSHRRLLEALAAATGFRMPGVKITARVDPVQLM